MPIVHQTQLATVHAGDCLDVLREMPDESVHAVITDPPYGLSNTTPAQVSECLREWSNGNTSLVPIKSRGYMGQDWDSFVPPPAVWEECLRVLKPGGHLLAFAGTRTQDLMGVSVRLAGFDVRDSFAWISSATFPKSHNLKGDWEGWGTGLKPSHEPVIMARKPFKGTVAANVQKHDTGALNINVSRTPEGRHPANVLLDEAQAAALDEQSGVLTSGSRNPSTSTSASPFDQATGVKFKTGTFRADSGGASRFFYCAKASKRERPDVAGVTHPTVKPITLMRYLIRMVTPPGGTILDPFAGSGTTLEAATQEGFTSIGIEAHPDYLPLIAARLERNAA